METALLTSLVEALDQPALFIGNDHLLQAVNSQAETVLGARLLGRHFAAALRHPDAVGAIQDCLDHGTQRKARISTRVAQADTTYTVRCTFVEGDGTQGVLVVLTDITNSEQVLQLRREFVANVSHELRTPLTSMMGFVETLQGPAKHDSVARERFLGIMSDEIARMNRLVDDLLSLSHVEAVQRRRPQDDVDLCAVVASVINALRPMAEANDTKLSAPSGSLMIKGDADQLRQVVSNLVENALKYGGQGVRVDVTLTPPEHDTRLREKTICLQVSDTGAGFDPIHIPRLAERFYRIDGHRSREKGGTGLGLAIVKHIIQRHRGRLEINSTPGQGTVFKVFLPTR